ncbi:MAG: hypothetical protein ACPLRY_08455 [Candidatus Bathyarchaeales archaeon]
MNSQKRSMKPSQKESSVQSLQTLPKAHIRNKPQNAEIQGSSKITIKITPEKGSSPRILKISLHTFRHWKATMVYITIEQGLFSNASNDEFYVKTARTVEEACKLAEVGFEYFDTIEGIHIYRRRK